MKEGTKFIFRLIAVTEYGNTNQRYASPRYIVEFPEESINKAPKSITDALVKHYKIDLNPTNLLKELKKNGVENIFITACGFSPIRNKDPMSNYLIMPHGFMGHEFDQEEYHQPNVDPYVIAFLGKDYYKFLLDQKVINEYEYLLRIL